MREILDPIERGWTAGALAAALTLIALIAWKRVAIDAWISVRIGRLLPGRQPKRWIQAIVIAVFGIFVFGEVRYLLEPDVFQAFVGSILPIVVFALATTVGGSLAVSIVLAYAIGIPLSLVGDAALGAVLFVTVAVFFGFATTADATARTWSG